VGQLLIAFAYPSGLPVVHNVFHMSQLRKCAHEPEMRVINEANAWIQLDLSLVEHPMRILDTKKKKNKEKISDHVQDFMESSYRRRRYMGN
jgi:hypothetical protein